MKRFVMIFSTCFLLIAFGFVTAQTYVLNLGDVYLPALAEVIACTDETPADFGFTANNLEQIEAFVLQNAQPIKDCYLFRDAHDLQASMLIATIVRDFAAQGYWHGVPKDYGGLHLVQNETNQTLGFSFLNEQSTYGPDAGIAGFKRNHPDGLILHLWSVYIPKH